MDHGGRRERESSQVFCDVRAYVSCRGYVGILMRARIASLMREPRWHRGSREYKYPVLGRRFLLSGIFLLQKYILQKIAEDTERRHYDKLPNPIPMQTAACGRLL